MSVITLHCAVAYLRLNVSLLMYFVLSYLTNTKLLGARESLQINCHEVIPAVSY